MVENQIPLATKLLVGSCVFALQTIGVDAGPIIWSMFGAVLGMSKAAPTSRWRAAVVFFAVVMACALIGTYISARFMNGDKISANSAACISALFFHLFWNAASEQFPRLFSAVSDIAVQFFQKWVNFFGGNKS